MTQKHKGILFLDMDGVLCTPRMWLANGGRGHNQLDPVCVKMLDLFCNKHELSLVCSSAWRIDNRVPDILATHGFTAHFVRPYENIRDEPDYSRVNTPCHNMKEDSSRGSEIMAWLQKHNNLMEDINRFIIFDDEIASIECKPELQGHIVKCDMYNGITWEAYHQAEEIMKRLDGVKS